ncbi:hypothetical protein LY28_01110 [Ruminiclostridium sufflavum DSM 19573]|uniref:Adhesin n=1 Tax=Ruminiclostridium sufflavum DSM 19573 TaxID=1121337 RepID=A0A318XP02_9FIRM|nr:hypothetical protein [Ruminiclostridium sufflavum]PYG88755.1 hypothetical protein LY28_01110 [Ruminiclostridium sufflavum DSM 19573]
MKRKYLSGISITLIFAMLLLVSGCGVRINGKEYEFFSASEKDEASVLDGIAEEASDGFTSSVDRQDAGKVAVSASSGNIKIKRSDTSQLKIEANKRVKGASRKDKDAVLKNMDITVERNGKTIEIVVKTKNRSDFWDWLKDNYKAFQVSIDFEILLPDGINTIEVDTGAGNIDINDISAELLISSGAGNIDIRNVNASGQSELEVGAGNISFDGNVNDIKSFEASSGAGNIDFKVPGSTRMSLEANTGVGILSGAFIKENSDDKFSFDEDINGGGPKVELSSGVGNVSADKK